MSKTVASLPILHGYAECESELLMSATLSSCDSLQFIPGSLLSPVSIAWMCFVWSLKQSLSELNPDMLPKTENHGVHACAGIISISWLIFLRSSTNLSHGMLNIGLPS